MDDDTELDLSPSYVSQFQTHLAQVKAHISGNTKHVLPSSFIAPGGYWTSSEKNAFFHALARYSPLRPDLIAAHVKSKSIVDVSAYIEQLQNGSKANPIPWKRQNIDIAFEVSDAWIDLEEQYARSFTTAEPIWDGEQRKASRQAECSQKEHELLDTTYSFDEWRRGAEARWNREDALRCLDDIHLNVLERILRTGDPTEHVLDSAAIDASNPSQGPSSAPRPAPIGQISRSVSAAPSNSTSNPCVAGEPQHQASASSRLPDSTTVQQGPLLLTPQSEPAADSPAPKMVLEDLSPVSRRRLQKRLYMRRKRAAQSGQSADCAPVKLRPGRERKEKKLQPRARTYNTGKRKRGGVMIHDQEVVEQSLVKKRSKSGMTKPYRLRQSFAAQKIDPAELQQSGLGLFHLSTLSRLIELYKSGYTEESTTVVTSISADTIHLLRSIAIDFASEVIYLAIVLKGQEVRVKGDVKVWRLGSKEISVDTIESCLEMMGLEKISKKDYFERLLSPGSKPNTASTDIAEAEMSGIAHPGGAGLERWLEHQTSCIHEGYLSIMEYHDNDCIMSLNVDERRLRGELEEEKSLDHHDDVLVKQYEAELWRGTA